MVIIVRKINLYAWGLQNGSPITRQYSVSIDGGTTLVPRVEVPPLRGPR